ncbi:MAG: hypothetical protein FJX63_10860, partial [Alphaproteobacteria bacterium]|nr:hypothetical protein [Alphaproteobacteria bacterium]
MDGLGFLVLVATFIIAVVALNKSSKLDARLAQLKVEFGKLKDELTALRCGPLPTAEAPPIETLAEEAAAAPAASEEAPAEAAAAAEAMAEPVLTEAPVAAPPA